MISENLKSLMTEEEGEKVRHEINVFVHKAKELVIKTETDNTNAAQLMAAYKAEIKKRKASDLYVKSAEAKIAATSAFKALTEMIIDPLTESVEIITQKSVVFLKAETERRAQLQAIEDAKVAEAQRKADERAAEAQRKADEAYAAKCAKAAELNRPAPIAPAYVPPAVVVPRKIIASVSAPAGTSYPKRWSAKVIDKMAFLQAVIDGRQEAYLVEIVMPPLNAKATASKVENAVIAPGVIAVSTPYVSQR